MSYIPDRKVTPSPITLPVVKPAENKGATPAVKPASEAAAVVVTDLAPQDSSGVKAAVDTPIDPVVDERAQFPPKTAKPAGDPTATAVETIAPKTLPTPLQESYADLSKRLNANPQVNYIDIEKQDQNKGLSQFLNQFKEQLDNTPGLREKLAQTKAGKELLEVLENAAKGALSSQDILKLQTFIVSAGEDISHPNSPNGIDGAFGPRTHQGLQNAFDKLLSKPDETIAKFETNFANAAQLAQERIADYENMGGNVPSGGYGEEASPGPGGTRGVRAPSGQTPVPGDESSTGAVSTPPPADRTATGLGRQITEAVGKSRPVMADYLRRNGGYYCYRGVKDVLSRVNPPINLTGGSAYQAADQLRAKYSDRFQEVKLTVPPNQATRDYLKSLPAGAIVVWGHSNNPAKYEAGKAKGNGYAHGHISVAMGNGYEFSDRDRPQITAPGDPERYGSLTVFLPKDAAAQPTQ